MNISGYPSYFDDAFEPETSICDVCTYDCSETGICIALEVIYNE